MLYGDFVAYHFCVIHPSVLRTENMKPGPTGRSRYENFAMPEKIIEADWRTGFAVISILFQERVTRES